jgi:hypothetical protein
MVKKKKNNNIDIPPVPREAIAAVRGERIFWNCCGASWRGPFHERRAAGGWIDSSYPKLTFFKHARFR